MQIGAAATGVTITTNGKVVAASEIGVKNANGSAGAEITSSGKAAIGV
jgi:trimeric autotransporter adhesin